MATNRRDRALPLRLLAVGAASLIVACGASPEPHAAESREPFQHTAKLTRTRDGEPEVYFVRDVEDQFAKLSLRPEALGFDIGSSPNPSQAKHYQGLARSHGRGVPYLFVSRSGNCPGFFSGCQLADDNPGNLLIVQLASRGDHGERLRSNRLRRGTDIDDTRPDSSDTTVAYLSFDGQSGWPAWGHPGGMQLVGDILVLPMETPYPNDCDPNCETAGGGSDNAILFLDISEPTTPVLTSTFEVTQTDDWSAGLVGVTPVLNGAGDGVRYLMLVTGKGGTELRFYLSNATDTAADTTDLSSADLDWTLVDTRTENEIEDCLGGADWHTGVGDSHQTLNFVREGDLGGALYMVGARNTTPLPGGEDWLDLYLIDEDALGDEDACLFTLRDSHHMTSKPIMGGGDSANFAAAGGVYVSPSGELLFYSAEYDNDGPSQTVRFGEWRHREGVREGSPTRKPTTRVDDGPFTVAEGASTQLSAAGEPAISKAYLMLFEDDGVGLSLPGVADKDDWLMVDYDDWGEDDFDDFREEDYSDDAGSWRWFAPPGCTLRANDDDFGDDDFPGKHTKTLHGTGSVVEATDLDAVDNNAGDGSMDDEITSMQFFSNCDDYYDAPLDLAWDYDLDGSFETPGAMPDFSAAGLDGPSTVTVAVRAEHPTDTSDLGLGAAVETTIAVVNVPPTVDAGTDFEATEAELLTRTFAFGDPGAPDTHTAVVDWGDEIGPVGATVDEAANSTKGEVRSSHTYGDNGSFQVEVCVTDDDGGEGCDAATVTVTNVAPSLTVDTSSQIELPGEGWAFLARQGEATGFAATGFDPGSDDLEIGWSVADIYAAGATVHADSTYHCNDPSETDCPDGLPSSQTHHFPMEISDATAATFALPGVYDVAGSLVDDDGGAAAGTSLALIVTGNRQCTETPSNWRRELIGHPRATLEPDVRVRLLHIAEFASEAFSELLCPATHEPACMLEAATELLTDNGVALDDDPSNMRSKTLEELLTLWLNFAAGAVPWATTVGESESFHDAVFRWEAVVADPASTHDDLNDIRREILHLNRVRPCHAR